MKGIWVLSVFSTFGPKLFKRKITTTIVHVAAYSKLLNNKEHPLAMCKNVYWKMLAVVMSLWLLKITMTMFVSRFQVIRMDFQDIGMVNISIFYFDYIFSAFEKWIKIFACSSRKWQNIKIQFTSSKWK